MVATPQAQAPRPVGLDDESLQLVLESLGEFGRRELPETLLRELDREDRVPVPVMRQLFGPEIGLHLLFLPESAGGMGAGAQDICTVAEALAGLDLGVATSVLATALGIDPIRVGGTPAQQETWLGRIADEGWLVAYGVTEPGAGSHVAALRTRAEPAVQDGVAGFRLHGTKCFITNGSVADLYTILARTPEGPSFFVVERATPGLSPGRREEKHGIRASDTAEVLLDDVFVPRTQLLGEVPGQGLAQAAAVFGYTRLMVAAFGLGAGVAAQRRAVAYARERVQFDSALVAKQGLTHKLLLPHIVRLQAARAYIQEIARRLDAGGTELQVEGSVAKLFATEAGCAAADAAVQVHGGYGYVKEYHVEKIRRDVRITTIYEGTSEIQQEIVGRDRWRRLQIRGGAWAREHQAELEALHRRAPDTGADLVARALSALVALVGAARAARLGRQQHAIFELADAVAGVEVAASLARKAARLPAGAPLRAMARIQAGDAACQVAHTSARVLAGTATMDAAAYARLDGALHPGGLLAAASGRVTDLDVLAARLPEDDLLDDPLPRRS